MHTRSGCCQTSSKTQVVTRTYSTANLTQRRWQWSYDKHGQSSRTRRESAIRVGMTLFLGTGVNDRVGGAPSIIFTLRTAMGGARICSSCREVDGTCPKPKRGDRESEIQWDYISQFMSSAKEDGKPGYGSMTAATRSAEALDART